MFIVWTHKTAIEDYHLREILNFNKNMALLYSTENLNLSISYTFNYNEEEYQINRIEPLFIDAVNINTNITRRFTNLKYAFYACKR